MKMFALIALVLALSGCTVFGGVSHDISAGEGYYIIETTHYDYWNGKVVTTAYCNELLAKKGSNGIFDKKYIDCYAR